MQYSCRTPYPLLPPLPFSLSSPSPPPPLLSLLPFSFPSSFSSVPPPSLSFPFFLPETQKWLCHSPKVAVEYWNSKHYIQCGLKSVLTAVNVTLRQVYMYPALSSSSAQGKCGDGTKVSHSHSHKFAIFNPEEAIQVKAVVLVYLYLLYLSTYLSLCLCVNIICLSIIG